MRRRELGCSLPALLGFIDMDVRISLTTWHDPRAIVVQAVVHNPTPPQDARVEAASAQSGRVGRLRAPATPKGRLRVATYGAQSTGVGASAGSSDSCAWRSGRVRASQQWPILQRPAAWGQFQRDCYHLGYHRPIVRRAADQSCVYPDNVRSSDFSPVFLPVWRSGEVRSCLFASFGRRFSQNRGDCREAVLGSMRRCWHDGKKKGPPHIEVGPQAA